jgi:hypothetical protein
VQFLHVPYKGNADSTQALMGGHVMVQSDATGWGKFVDQGAFRLLVTFGDQRTRWGAPTAKELGYDVVSYSPYGLVGPKGMDPKVVKILHDAFKKAIDDPENAKVLQMLDQVYWYKVPGRVHALGRGDLRERKGADRAARPDGQVTPQASRARWARRPFRTLPFAAVGSAPMVMISLGRLYGASNPAA